jgi:hypothetical protein
MHSRGQGGRAPPLNPPEFASRPRTWCRPRGPARARGGRGWRSGRRPARASAACPPRRPGACSERWRSAVARVKRVLNVGCFTRPRGERRRARGGREPGVSVTKQSQRCGCEVRTDRPHFAPTPPRTQHAPASRGAMEEALPPGWAGAPVGRCGGPSPGAGSPSRPWPRPPRGRPSANRRKACSLDSLVGCRWQNLFYPWCDFL